MNNKRSLNSARVLVAVGVLLAVSPMFLSDIFNIKLPDFVTGTLAGGGVGLEIMGILTMRKRVNGNVCKECRPEVDTYV
jgi:hypothetical protein